MSDTFRCAKKEFKVFFSRKDYRNWYLMLLGAQVLLPFVPFIKEDKERVLICMMFISFLIPNNLTLETIGGEISRKTIETLVATRIKILSVIAGKMLFVFTTGVVGFCLPYAGVTVIQKNIRHAEWFALSDFRNILFLVVLGLFALIILGDLLAFFLRNLKLCGYIVSFINAGLVWLLSLELHSGLPFKMIMLFTEIVLFILLSKQKKHTILTFVK